MKYSSEIFFFLKSFQSLQLGARALYSKITSSEFEGFRLIETPPLISLFLSMLKLAVLIKNYFC
jgi:hypothetical protein